MYYFHINTIDPYNETQLFFLAPTISIAFIFMPLIDLIKLKVKFVISIYFCHQTLSSQYLRKLLGLGGDKLCIKFPF